MYREIEKKRCAQSVTDYKVQTLYIRKEKEQKKKKNTYKIGRAHV